MITTLPPRAPVTEDTLFPENFRGTFPVPAAVRFSLRLTNRPNRCPFCMIRFTKDEPVIVQGLGTVCIECSIEYYLGPRCVNLNLGCEIKTPLQFDRPVGHRAYNHERYANSETKFCACGEEISYKGKRCMHCSQQARRKKEKQQ